MVTTVTDNSPQSINTSLFSLDKEVQEVKKIAESFDEKLSGIDIETGVISVNGKQGVVELTASDVDALPSSTVIPTTTSELENTSGFITSSSSITGNAATATTADKVKNALTVNGKTYDGSSAVDAGVQTVANGGTGATTAKDAFENLANGLPGGAGPLDTEHIIFQNGNRKNWGLYTLSQFWEYIKGKISSVLGLTASNYGGKSAKSSFLDEYVGAGGARPTSGNIVPKDASEYGGMRKDVVTSSMTDSGRPGQDGHLLTMFWDNDGRWDSQFFVSNDNPLTVKARTKANESDYGNWVDVITSKNIGSQTVAKAETANKIKPNYTSVALTEVTSYTNKYIKLADCHWNDTGTLQVHLNGNNFVDTLVINFGGGNGLDPMLCGHYSGNSHRVYSVIAQKGSAWTSDYSIHVKVGQETNLTVNVALLTGSCTIGISESTTAPTNISEWSVSYGLFGNITSPEITSLEQRVAALESKI